MDARPVLVEIGRLLGELRLDAVLIGNAAAALQGAPVTTVDVDFLFRKTPRNLSKLKVLATRLRATVLRPYYPASEMYRVSRDDDGLQIDFMGTIHGIRSFEGLRGRASLIDIDGVSIRVASLADIIRSKKAARRPRDLRELANRSSFEKTSIAHLRAARYCGQPSPAIMSEGWRRRLKKPRSRKTQLAAVARESDRALRDLIRRWQALPPERRTQFLRKRVGIGRSAL